MLIYKITNKINGKIYIGQTKNLDKRWREHCSDKWDSAVSLAIRKHGVEQFTLTTLGEYPDAQDLNNAEDYFIDFYNTLSPGGYNLVTGQQKARVWSEESLAKASESKRGAKNPMFGKKHSLEHRARSSAANKGKPKSEEHRAKLRVAQLGKKASPEARIKMSISAKKSVNSGRFVKRSA